MGKFVVLHQALRTTRNVYVPLYSTYLIPSVCPLLLVGRITMNPCRNQYAFHVDQRLTPQVRYFCTILHRTYREEAWRRCAPVYTVPYRYRYGITAYFGLGVWMQQPSCGGIKRRHQAGNFWSMDSHQVSVNYSKSTNSLS